MRKGVFLESDNVAAFGAALNLAADTEKGRPGMMMLTGETGIGKTVAARNAHAERGGVYLRTLEGWSQHDFLQAVCFEVCGMRPYGSGKCKQRIIHELDREPQVIWMDEADRLNTGRLEDLRDIHDVTGTTIVLIGEEGLPSKVGGRRRIDRRIPREYRIRFRPLSLRDISLYAAEACGLALSAEAAAALGRHTRGNFRDLHNAMLSLEQMARAAESAEVDEAMLGRLAEAARKGGRR